MSPGTKMIESWWKYLSSDILKNFKNVGKGEMHSNMWFNTKVKVKWIIWIL